jgi:hypothetical protein
MKSSITFSVGKGYARTRTKPYVTAGHRRQITSRQSSGSLLLDTDVTSKWIPVFKSLIKLLHDRVRLGDFLRYGLWLWCYGQCYCGVILDYYGTSRVELLFHDREAVVVMW